MKWALALETIHREVVGTRTGHLAFSVSEPMPRGSGERVSYTLICDPCKYREERLGSGFLPPQGEAFGGGVR